MPFNMILRHDFLSIIEFNNHDYTLRLFMVIQLVLQVLPDLEPHQPLVYSVRPVQAYMDNLSLVKINSSITSFKLNSNNKPPQPLPQLQQPPQLPMLVQVRSLQRLVNLENEHLPSTWH